MAAPQVLEIEQKRKETVIIWFDGPLDEEIQFPPTSFSINYGKVPITGASYYGTSGIIITLGREMTYRDKLEVNYQPPSDLTLALRAPVGANASDAIIKRNAIRAFYKVPVKNLMRPDENTWKSESNLGGGAPFVWDPNDPEMDLDNVPGFDICGDGSIIIGNPNNIADPNESPSISVGVDGAITALNSLVGGAGYVDGTYNGVTLVGGSGVGAVATMTVANSEVTQVTLSSAGSSYVVNDVLTAAPADLGNAGSNFEITVTQIYNTDDQAPFSQGQVTISDVRHAPYPDNKNPSPRSATPDDFVLAYGLKEAIQLSNIDDANAIEPNTQKIWMAIQDACALIDNYIIQASRAGKLLISSSRRRTSLIIARYYLDTVRRREDVKSDYELAVTELDKARSLADGVRPDLPWWADPCGDSANGIRSHRIPQYYNGVSGKGFDGYWVDSATEEAADFRTDGENSQNNNNLGNGTGAGLSQGGGSIPAEPQQPTDDGGVEAGGANP